MTSTPPPSSPPPYSAPAPDWSSLVDHWAKISDDWFKELSRRAEDNAPKLQAGSYDSKAWLGDVSWFVKSLADNAAACAKAATDLFPQQQQ